jgi:CubicO group peptidase (beta-lactamase class C family)
MRVICRFPARTWLLAVGLVFIETVGRADDPAVVQSRITTVENHLIPPVRIKGRSPEKLVARMRERRVPGLSVAVINNYKLEWAKGYGLADSQTTSPVTPETLFQAASISKPVSAVAALKLVEQGVLDLDRDVNQQLKSWKVPENEFTRKHSVDLRGLLSHTAGLTVSGFPGYAVGKPLPTLLQVLDGQPPASTKPVRVDKLPGNGFRYAGGGTIVVQQLLVDVTGRPFPDLMQDLVLRPLSMKSSTYEQPLPAQRQSRAASGHNQFGKPIPGRWRIYPEMAPAGLWTTPSDLARFAIEIQLAHEGKSQKVLSHKMVEQMLTPQGGGLVGLGPFLEKAGSDRYFTHGGSNQGFRCELVAYLDRGQGAVVMTNSDNGGSLAKEVLGGIAAAYGWPGFVSPERELAKIDPKVIDGYLGAYSLGLLGEVKIERRKDRLYAVPPLGGDVEVFFESATRFVTEEPNVTGRIVTNDHGQVSEIVVDLNGQQMHAKKKSK